MLTKKLSCPSCGVGLKIAETLAAGARITCPRCGLGFPVPNSNGQAADSKVVVVRTRKTDPLEYSVEDVEDEPEARPAVRKRRRPAPEDDDDDIDEPPISRKRHKKKKKPQSNTVLIVSLVLVGIMLLAGGGVATALLLWPKDKKSDQVASNNPPTRSPARRGPSDRSEEADPNRPPNSPRAPRQGESESTPAPVPSPSRGEGQGGSGSGSSVDGRQVFQQNCARCHRTDGSGGGRGPDLSTIGKSHEEDWFVEFVRNPRSQKPNSRGMPSFGGKLTEEELRAVARFLAGLR